ncbi:hypothetical protein LTSESEN_0701, partial [Salmonella enterica subsp. enterica serovar Senftenberg str. A4-543]
ISAAPSGNGGLFKSHHRMLFVRCFEFGNLLRFER